MRTPNDIGGTVIRVCKICNKEFKRFRSYTAAKYCSMECRRKGLIGNHNGIKKGSTWYYVKCNGPRCRGKKFAAKSPVHKLCPKCREEVAFLS